jgi:ferritin-like metal-binding protein YciE
MTADRAVADGPSQCPYHASPEQATAPAPGRLVASDPKGPSHPAFLQLPEHCRSGGVETRETSLYLLAPMECNMSTKDKNLNDLFLDTLKDIYYAEKQILKALPKMAKAAQSDKLRAAFEKHHGETEGQVERLERIFELIDKPARGKTCEAIQGLLDEGKEIMEEYKGTEALDAGMVAAAQAVEHYEIARYGTLKQWAQQLGIKDAVALLDATLQEEKKTDESLTSLAEADVNLAAAA